MKPAFWRSLDTVALPALADATSVPDQLGNSDGKRGVYSYRSERADYHDSPGVRHGDLSLFENGLPCGNQIQEGHETAYTRLGHCLEYGLGFEV